VSMISDGRDTLLCAEPRAGKIGLSASGSDIFFCTHTSLVGQDTDIAADIYDAREGGGFPAPEVKASCSGEACQGNPSAPLGFGPSASSVLQAGGNLSSLGAAGGGTLAKKVSKPKPLTQAQKLAKALKACNAKPRKKRAACKSQARKKYGKKAKAKKANRRGR
jgi:hypothetical protein